MRLRGASGSVGRFFAPERSIYRYPLYRSSAPFRQTSCVAFLTTTRRIRRRQGTAGMSQTPLQFECPLLGAEKSPSICRSEEHTSELQSLMRISYAVFCLKKKKTKQHYSEQNKINTQH